MSVAEKKVYDYDPGKVRDRLVGLFRERRGEATTADLVALTGLPRLQVENEVKAVSDEYGARLRVTESGEILYSFPRGMRSRYRGIVPGARRAWKAFKKGAAAVATLLFKVWIVGMLVGYFVLFILLAVLALLASVAISASGKGDSRDDRRGGGLGGLWLTGRIFESIIRIWFYSELFAGPRDGHRRAARSATRRPLHKAVFSFVFGDGDPDSGQDEAEKRSVLAFLQANKGIVTLPEFMAITGLEPAKAEQRINRYLFEFEGSPEVSPGGVIYFSFPSLLRSQDKVDRSRGFSLPRRPIAPFSSNPRKANAWFCAINGANLLFGSYFAAGALAAHPLLAPLYSGQYAAKLVMTRGWDAFYLFVHQLLGKLGGVADPSTLIGIVLAAVPLSFAVLFFAVPAIRARRLAARNEEARKENLRRVAYRAALDSPLSVRPESIPVADEAARPKDPRAAERALDGLAAWAGGEPSADGAWSFPELARSREEAAKARAAVDGSAYELGATVFDSDSDPR